MKPTLFLRALARTLFRRLRLFWFSLRGANPLVTGAHIPGFGWEIRSASRLLDGRTHLPSRVSASAMGSLWDTAIGQFHITDGLDPLYIRLTVEEQLADIYLMPERPGVVLDCGSNIGLFARRAIESGAERVIAFEPAPGNVACLRANMAEAIRQGRMEIIEKGVYNKVGELRFSTFDNDPFANAVSEEGNMSIAVTTVDATIAEMGLKRVDFIKMDIEGSELAALDGAAATLRNFRPRVSIAVEHTSDHFDNARQVIEKMNQFGYDYVVTQSLPYDSSTVGKRLISPFCVAFLPRP